jgi:hypothetical protein
VPEFSNIFKDFVDSEKTYGLKNTLCTGEFYHLGYNAVLSIESQPVFQRNMYPPSSGLNNKPSILVCCMAYSSTLRVEATYSSEMLVDFLQATWHYITELL